MPCQPGHYISDEEALEAHGGVHKFIPYSRRDKRIARMFLIVGVILGSVIGAGIISIIS